MAHFTVSENPTKSRTERAGADDANHVRMSKGMKLMIVGVDTAKRVSMERHMMGAGYQVQGAVSVAQVARMAIQKPVMALIDAARLDRESMQSMIKRISEVSPKTHITLLVPSEECREVMEAKGYGANSVRCLPMSLHALTIHVGATAERLMLD